MHESKCVIYCIKFPPERNYTLDATKGNSWLRRENTYRLGGKGIKNTLFMNIMKKIQSELQQYSATSGAVLIPVSGRKRVNTATAAPAPV